MRPATWAGEGGWQRSGAGPLLPGARGFTRPTRFSPRTPAQAAAPAPVDGGRDSGPRRCPTLRGPRARRLLPAATVRRRGALGGGLDHPPLRGPRADLRGAPTRRQLQLRLPLQLAPLPAVPAQRPGGAPSGRWSSVPWARRGSRPLPDCTLLQECPSPHLLPALTLA